MSDLVRLRRRRSGHKLAIRKLFDEISSLVQHDVKQPGNREKLLSLNTSLAKQQTKLLALDEDILELIDDDTETETEILEASNFDLQIEEHLELIKSQTSAQNADGASKVTSSSLGLQTAAKINLPRLSFEKFTGKPLEWIPFFEQFTIAVDQHEGLDDVEKFSYLRSLLSGDASKVIAGLPLTSVNYKQALNLLKDRYGNQQVIVSSHMDALYQIKGVSSSSDLRGLRNIFDQLEINVRALSSMGIPSDHYGPMLIPLLMSKLPDEIRLSVARESSNERWDFNQVLEVLRNELAAREKCLLVNAGPSDTSVRKTTQPWKQPSSAATLQIETKRNSNGRKLWCSFCKGEHNSHKCTEIVNPTNRRSSLMKQGKCFRCLRRGHMARDCKSQLSCFSCGKDHHIALCDQREQKQDSHTPKQENVDSSTLVTNTIDESSVLLQTAQAVISNPSSTDKSKKIRVIFDSGSQKSYLLSDVAKSIELMPNKKDPLLIKTFGNSSAHVKEHDQVSIELHAIDETKIEMKAYLVPVICSPISSQCNRYLKSEFDHLSDLTFAESVCDANQDLDIQLLIGADYYWEFFNGEVRRGDGRGPTALNSKLGWVLSGPLGTKCSSAISSNIISAHCLSVDSSVANNICIENELSKMWDLESIGIKRDEPSVYDSFVSKIKFVEGRYQVDLPFKIHHPTIADNFTLAYDRLSSLLRKLRSKPDILSQYDNVIREQVKSGIVEVIQEDHNSVAPGSVYYMPHREVVRLDKTTTKVRVVFDASAKRQGQVSLNDCLYKGPSLTPLLYDILLRWRVPNVALVGDIEKAFLNIEVSPEHRDYQRFLWVRDISDDKTDVVTMRSNRVVFGNVSSPFLLNGTINHHVRSYYSEDPQKAAEILNCMYVDDWCSGADDLSEAIQLYERVKACMLDGGFRLRKWMSNDVELLTYINGQQSENLPERSNEAQENPFSSTDDRFKGQQSEECKVLGVIWCRDLDEIKMDLKEFAANMTASPFTKRVVLSTAAKFYDPLGNFSPLSVVFKIMFQDLCKSKGGWDDPLSNELKMQWYSIYKDFLETESISVPRCYFNDLNKDDIVSLQLHGFGDASIRAFGSVIFLRIEAKHKTECRLITSKSRVAPLSGETVPRLELLAGLTTARLVTNVRQALESVITIDSTMCWLDSSIALSWIKSVDKEYKTFVENRVTEIRGMVDPSNWRYCPTGENPADIISRGAGASVLATCDKWWYGPEFLKGPPQEWPANPPSLSSDEGSNELKSERVDSTTVNVTHHSRPSITDLIVPENFSSFTTLVRVTSWVLRFTENIKRKKSRQNLIEGHLSQPELDFAEKRWYVAAQQAFTDSRQFPQVKNSLGLFKDSDGIWRCRGRIGNAPIPFGSKHPILLPSDLHISTLIIRKCHFEVLHNGVCETLTQIRSKYWLVKGRQTVKKVISRCVTCKKLEGQSYDLPNPPPLPDFRVDNSYAFTNIGIDFAGPVYVRDIFCKDKLMHKAYITVFTCASSRAVHLDLVPDLSSNSFLRCLQRMISRRSYPRLIVTDNAKTFKSVDVQAFAASHGITWHFNVPRSPNWGGFFERMVRSVKRCLKKSMGNSRLSYEELLSVLVQVEGVLNSRPLTYVYDEVNQAITPSHLMLGKRILSLPSGSDESDSNFALSVESVNKRTKYISVVLTHFWKRWCKEYLTQLREHHQGSNKEQRLIIKEGDIVSLFDESVRRQSWKLAKVLKLLTGRDGNVRAAIILVNGKGDKKLELKRPIQKLYPLEVTSVVDSCIDSNVTKCNDQLEVSVRPRRAASYEADLKINIVEYPLGAQGGECVVN